MPVSDSKAKEGVKAEMQPILRTLLPYNTRQTHGNPPGLNKPPYQRISYGLQDEQQNKSEKEEHEHKCKQAETNNSGFLDSKVNCYSHHAGR